MQFWQVHVAPFSHMEEGIISADGPPQYLSQLLASVTPKSEQDGPLFCPRTTCPPPLRHSTASAVSAHRRIILSD